MTNIKWLVEVVKNDSERYSKVFTDKSEARQFYLNEKTNYGAWCSLFKD